MQNITGLNPKQHWRRLATTAVMFAILTAVVLQVNLPECLFNQKAIAKVQKKSRLYIRLQKNVYLCIRKRTKKRKTIVLTNKTN